MSLSIQPDVTESLELRGQVSTISTWYPACKEIADRIVAAFLLLVLAPLMLVLMVLVKATSRGPAIYRQVRLGRDGKPFLILKFRSMRNDCEKQTGPKWASKKGDSRVTGLGRFLRKSHLDELPQLWNVLRGEMSLIGPRPERPEFVAKLELVIPDYRDRMDVHPGITGLAQVQLPADEDYEDVRRKVAYDLCYIGQVGPWLDLRIMIATAMKVAGIPLDSTGQILGLPGSFDAESESQDEAAALEMAGGEITMDSSFAS